MAVRRRMQQMGWVIQYLDWYPAEAAASGPAAPGRGGQW